MNVTVSKKMAQAGSALLLAAIFFPALAWGQTSWKGTVSTAWGTAENWTAGVPGTTVDAIIGDTNFTGSFQPALTRNATCKSLSIGEGSIAVTLTAAKAMTVRGAFVIGPNGTVTHSGRTITLLGDWTNSGVYNATKQTAVMAFSGVATQALVGATTFRKISIGAGSTLLLKSNIGIVNACTVNGTVDPGDSPTFTVSDKATLTVNAGGRLLVKAATFAGNYAMTGATTLNAASIVDYAAGTNQTISSALTYGTLRISGAGAKTLAGNLPALNSTAATAGNILLDAGTLDLSSYSANRGTTVAGGTFSAASGTLLKIGGTGTFPANFATRTLNPLSTVEYSGTAQSVSPETYGHLTFSSSSGAAIKTMPATAMTVAGNLTSTTGSGTAVAFTAAAPVTVNGTVSIGTGTTFGGGASAHTVDGNWINAGTFNGGSGSVTLRGAGAVISGAGSNLFNTLTISGAGVTAASNTQVTVTGDFSTSGDGTFTHTSGSDGTLTMSGSGKTLSGSGISFNNLSVPGSVTSAVSFIIAGNLDAAGVLSATGGTLTMTGSGKTIAGTGVLSFFAVHIPGSITATVGCSLASDLSVAGSLTATTGTFAFVGTSSFSGAADLFDVSLNGSKLALGAGSTLGIGRTLSLTAGTFDVSNSTPNTVKYYAGGAQSILSTTYDNLLLSGTGTQTPTGPLTVRGGLTINSGATFSASGFTHRVYGNWVNAGMVNANTGTVVLCGDQDVSISGATSFNTLTVEKINSSALVTLNDSITAVAMNVATGAVYTGTNALTITSTREGNGTILGTITRTHAFTTNTPYAFEGPFNTINFSSVSGVTSITVRVAAAPPSDFPFGASLNRNYTVSLAPTGTCTATLRLHYQDSELNGNLESSMELWRYSGLWAPSGKTANSSTDNWVEQGGLADISGRWTFSDNASVAGWNGSVNSAWENAGNWSIIDGTPSLPPTSNDTVQIGMQPFTNPPSITTPVIIKSMTFGSAQTAELSLGSGGSLKVTGNIGGDWATSAVHSILVNDQSLTVEGDLVLGDGTTNHTIGLTIGTGSVSVAGSLSQSGGAGIVFSGAGQLSIGHDFLYGGGAFTAGTGTVTYNGALAQIVAGAINYHHLVFRKTGGTATLSTPASVGGNFLMETGGTFLVNASLSVTGNVDILSGATLNGGSSTLSVGGNWGGGGIFTPGSGTVEFNGAGTQTVAATTFNTLGINKTGGAAILAGNLSLGGNLLLSSGILDLSTQTVSRSVVGGTLTLAAGTTLKIGAGSAFPSNFASRTLSATSTVEYNGSSQNISPETYGNLLLSNGGSNPKTLTGPTTVAGDLTINSNATFSGASYALIAQGHWTNNGAFTASSGSVTLSGSSKTLHGTNNFNTLSVPGSYTASGDVSVGGTMTVSGSFNAGNTATLLSGNVQNTGVFTSGGIITFSGAAVQSLVLNAGFASSGTVNFNGSFAPVFSGVSSPSFHNVTIVNSAGISPNAGWTIGGTFTVDTGATFNGGPSTHTFGAAFTNNGSVTSSGTLVFSPTNAVTLKLRGTSFSSSGDVVFGGSAPVLVTGDTLSFTTLHIANTHPSGVTPATNWTVNGDCVINEGAIFNGGSGLSHTMAGNWIGNGTFNGQSSTVSLTGTAELSGIGTTVFNHVNIVGTITASADFSVAGNFANNGTFDATGAAVTFTGTDPSTLGGTTTPTLLDTLDINKSAAAVTLLVNVTNLTSLTVSGGTLDASTFTIGQDVAGGSLSVAAGATLRIGGSRTLPEFTAVSLDPLSTVEYYGASAQTIVVQNYGHLTSSSSGARTLATASPIGIAGTFTPGTNGYTVTGSTITYNGAGPQTIAAFNYNNLSNASTGARILSPTGTIGIAGVFTPGSNPYTNINSAIHFNGGSQTIPAFTYFHLLTSGSGVKTIGGASTVNGSLTLAGGSLTNSGFTVIVNGDIVNSIAYSGTGRLMLANGTLPHALSGTGTYVNLEMNDPNGATLLTNLTVNGTLALTTGIIATVNHRTLIGVSGGVTRVSGHINGNLQKPIPTGSPSRTFEIGDAASYAPVTLQFTNVTVSGTMTARTTGGEHPDIAGSGINAARDANRYWSITNSGIVFSNFSATLTFVPGDLDAGAVATNFIIAVKSGGAWTQPAIASRTSTSIQSAGITTVGDFVAGEPMGDLFITYPDNGRILPFSSVMITATGSAVGAVGSLWFTNRWDRGVTSGTLPAATGWSTPLSLPDYGDYTFTLYGSNVTGTVMQDTVRFRRKPSRVYWLTPP